MTPDELIAELYRRFRLSGAWPKARLLQVELRQHGNLRLLAARAGKESVVYEDGQDGVCRVTLRGLRRCAAAAPDLEAYVAFVRELAARYISNGSEEVSVNELGSAVGADDGTVKRLIALLSRDNVFWSTWRGSGTDLFGSPSDDLVFLENVDSLEDIDRRLARLEDERREVGELNWGTERGGLGVRAAATEDASSLLPKLPMVLALQDARLRAATEHDLGEIARSLQSGAWKAAAILTGACLEALLLDIWLRREPEARERWPKTFPNTVKLGELANAAVQAGVISEDHRAFAGAIQRVRNLVHPLRASKEPAVTPALVGLLLSALRLLNEEVGADSVPR